MAATGWRRPPQAAHRARKYELAVVFGHPDFGGWVSGVAVEGCGQASEPCALCTSSLRFVRVEGCLALPSATSLAKSQVLRSW